MSELVTIHVKEGTANFLAWSSLGDRQRGKYRALAVGRIIRLWEVVKRRKRWTRITVLAPSNDARRRWTRRNLYTLEMAGLLELRMKKGVTEFRCNKLQKHTWTWKA